MACKRVTCPESAHLEMIEFEDTPLGMLIASCTRGGFLDCPRTCAARLDRRDRAFDELAVGDTTMFDLRLP